MEVLIPPCHIPLPSPSPVPHSVEHQGSKCIAIRKGLDRKTSIQISDYFWERSLLVIFIFIFFLHFSVLKSFF